MRLGYLAAASLCVCALSAGAQSYPTNFSGTNLATGLSAPTAFAIAPNGDVYICQQAGALRLWRPGSGLSTVTTFTVNSAGERGLIGVALDPAFAANRFLYVYYTAPTPAIHNRISRITLDAAGTAVVAGSEVALLDLNNLSGATNHNGGAIHFGLDGKLYAGVGDNANSSNSQSIANLLGKVLRINADGTIPADNPSSFPGIAGTTTGQNRAIWAVGLRNPFTFNVHPGTGRIFVNDVGEGTWEEINDGIAGRNYGWPGTEGAFNPATFPNFTLPLVAYHHSNGGLNTPGAIGNFTGSAITGGTFYSPYAGANPNFPIAFQNDYFFGDIVASIVRTFDPAANNGAGFATGVGGVVDLGVAPDNTLLILNGAGGGSGRLIRVTFTGTSGACCAPDGTCTLSNGLNCTAGSTFLWGTVSCSPSPCTVPTGACCRGSTCAVTTAAACSGANTSFVAAAACNTAGNTTTPCCYADFNQAGGITVQDIFDFLAEHFGGGIAADFNQSGDLTVQDIFDFLAGYFTGCV